MCQGHTVVCLLSLLLLSSAAGTSVTFQTGQTLTSNTYEAIYYNATYDTSISTQYNASWNFYNGETYFWGTSGPDWTYPLSDASFTGRGDSFRTLIRFASLHRVLPDNAVVQSAQMTLVFFNWLAPVQVHACFMTRPWEFMLNGPSFKSTGWRYSRWNGTASLPWTQQGGWADCDPRVNISFVVPVNGLYGYVSVTFALDAARVADWLPGKGAANYGLLLRATNGSVSLINSQWAKDSPALRRPALTLTYSTDPAAQPPAPSYPLQLGAVSRVWWVAPEGDDEGGSGQEGSPFRSPAKALFEAWPGDKIYLKTGVYPGAVDITRPRITLQSAPGHWGVVSLPLNDPQNAVNVITIRPGADYGVLQDLEITGGFYYGVMFFTSWENYGSMADRVSQGAGPNHWTLRNVRIHDTGGSGVKLVMKATNNTFTACEIYNTGARLRTAGHGIEAVQAYDITVRDCYFHDIPAAAVHLAGGTARAVLERNFVSRCGFGLNLGFATDYEYMDGINNPQLYEAIDATARNNIITAVRMAGINVWAARNTTLAHNTIWQAQEDAQACVLVAPYLHSYTPSGDVLTPSSGLTLWANILVRSPTARAGPVLQIRPAGLDPASVLLSAHNVYYDQRGLGPVPFQWGKGAMLEDERDGRVFVGNATGWARHCTADLGQKYCDVHSTEADPLLDAAFAPLPGCSPAAGRAEATLPSKVALVTDDFSGRSRPVGQAFDAGAVQSSNMAAGGVVKAIPPVPPALVGKTPYTGIGLGPVYDKDWPYSFWAGRVCKDIYVDNVKGTDAQASNYESKYSKPFKTIAGALGGYNQCDRILLRGGQKHVGGFGIFAPNVTITTNPADAPLRATVVCNNSGPTPCIRTGDGLYGGAAALTLTGFDVVMSGSAAGSCIHLNEGAGSGVSSYWAFYLAARGLQPTLTYIQNMSLTTCGLHGVKFSTFVRGVVLRGLTITSPRGTGVEVRGGGDLVVSGNKITGPGETAIRLGGGVRNVLVERNLIKNYTDRGILLGSDDTEVRYMDVDWARQQGPDWHDNINTTVRNNIIDGGGGAGIAFYSARDAVVVHNTLLGVAAAAQAGVLLNVSPKQTGPTQEVGPPNTNITFQNNIVSLGGAASSTLMVEARVLQGGTVNKQLTVNLPTATMCPAGHHHHHHRRSLQSGSAAGSASFFSSLNSGSVQGGPMGQQRRGLLASSGLPSFADAYVNAPGEQGRNPDGSCPLFPATHAWHQDVTQLAVHPNSDVIKSNIGGGRLHPDFGGGYTAAGGKRILYGIPFVVVDSTKTPLVKVDIGPAGYPDESDTSPAGFPFPPDAPVEGAYLNCPDSPCGGDRHVLVLDNATCTLYETWRSFPPGVTGTGRWQADILARFNLSRNALGRPLGWSSADAAGLAVLPGLVTWDEVATRGVIDHAIRFTGPNSRAAYAPPATHFAPAGYSGPDAPYMGMRVRLNASYDCGPLAPAARVFCTALKKYGGIFADNGGPWYFTGEATAKWDAVQSQLYDIAKIPSSAMEVLDSGCLCTNPECTVAECNGVPDIDPNALPLYAAVVNTSSLSFANNIYYKPATRATAGRYVDRRVPPLGPGYDGGLAGWQAYIKGDAGSVEKSPALNTLSYRPLTSSSPAVGKVPRLAAAGEDYYGVSRGPVGGKTDAGAALK